MTFTGTAASYRALRACFGDRVQREGARVFVVIRADDGTPRLTVTLRPGCRVRSVGPRLEVLDGREGLC